MTLQGVYGGGENVLKVTSPDNIMDTKKFALDNRKVVLFDDVVDKPDAVQKKIANYYTDGRQQNIIRIYIS